MAITGTARLAYAVEDLAAATRYFKDVGLVLERHADNASVFRLSATAVLYGGAPPLLGDGDEGILKPLRESLRS